jgi:tetratricopeptide (TPR) repeat protein
VQLARLDIFASRELPPQKDSPEVDTQTRHALKQDRLVEATASGLDWVQSNRANVIKLVIAVLVVAAIIVAASMTYATRSAQAQTGFGQAMDVYTTPLRQPGQPALPGDTSYATAAARAQVANPMFLDVAKRYGWFKVGANAEYFAGLTYLDMNQTSAAENQLEKASHSHDGELAALAKMALAGVYRQTNRQDQAVDLYQQIINHPTTTVPKAAAQLQLAGLYERTNPAQARRLYAVVKDQNKDIAAGQIASQKLTGAGK